MPPKIFITSATGLIGGDFLVVVAAKHPDWEISALVRDREKAKVISTHFPAVRVVHGSLDDTDILERESRAADVVLNFANCDHLAAAEVIVRGLSQRDPDRMGTVIHTSGAKIIAWEMESQPATWGKFIPRRYNDLDGVEELTRIPSPSTPNPTRASATITTSKTAIVCPPTVYGPSWFPAPTRSIQIPRLLNVVLRLRQAFTINGNDNRWNKIHTQDISELYMLLTEAAVDGRSDELGEFAWGDVTRKIAALGYQKGLVSSGKPLELSNEAVDQFWRGGQMNVCSTSLGEAQRARRL
ncbi:putative nucleoside-diphosphate-sugar epimerase [Aspergillus karnatakaensis]|uniref:putative nucleoside-diphosphate-sugar epimerase n=1 Tax=Aspergillus karnatakaensis TaxID=1810916 RepID=UPI003CCD3295